MTFIFVASLIGSMIIISNGYIFGYLIFKKKIQDFNIFQDSIFGFIYIGLIALLINFFLPINKLIGLIFLIISLIIFAYFFLKFKNKKQLIIILSFLSLTGFSILAFSTINRPDAGLYHLPFISILNENKLILGLTNLHYRFGQTSIFQYISAIHVNYIFSEEFLNIPLALLPCFYFLILYKNLKNEIESKDEKKFIAIFLIIAFSIYSFNRFSGFGNDGPTNIFIFILIIMLMNIKNIDNIKDDEFSNITLVSLFLMILNHLCFLLF